MGTAVFFSTDESEGVFATRISQKVVSLNFLMGPQVSLSFLSLGTIEDQLVSEKGRTPITEPVLGRRRSKYLLVFFNR